jgi:ATP-dependent DNA helicase RecG
VPHIDLKELAARESEQVEWKENVADVADVLKDIVAFANDLANLGGGYVVCGARELKDEHGFQKVELLGLDSSTHKKVEGAVMNGCRDLVDPPLTPILEELPTDRSDRRVLVFVIPASRRAHTFRTTSDTGKYYVRLSRSTREARNGLYRQLLLQKGELEPWDRRASATATVDDIDLIALRDALQQMGVFDPARGVDDYLSDTRALSPFVPPMCAREPLTNILRPRNFVVLLFGREPQRHVPGAYARFSIYPGLDRSAPHAELHELAGSVLSQIRRLEELLNVQAYTAFDKTDPTIPNAVKYPRRALQEAMVNAVAHRDYELVHPCRITVFSDRIELLSPGALVPGVSAEQLARGRASASWRNQSLAWFLNRLQLAQAEGQGIPTILRTMKEEGCPDPTFEATTESVLVVLPAHPRHAALRELRAIEQEVSLGRLENASRKVHALVERDPFDLRAVQVFAEVQRALAAPQAILDLVAANENRLERFPSLSLVHLADALLSMRHVASGTRQIASRLLSIAARGRFEEREARRLALSLLKIDEDDAALEFIERCLHEHPEWQSIAAFLQLRGRANLQLAHRCRKTAKNSGLPPQTRERAREHCRRYLELAERDLRDAQTRRPEPAVSDHIKRDLERLGQLRRALASPKRRPSDLK